VFEVRISWPYVGAGLLLSVTLAGCSLLSGGSADPAPTGASPVTVTAAPSPTTLGSRSAATPATPAAPGASVTITDFPTAAAPTTSPTPPTTKPGLSVDRTRLRGRSASASWDIAIPVFSGGTGAAEANRRVRAAANDLIAQVKREARRDGGVKRTLTGDGQVGTNDGRTVQVVIEFVDFLAGTAHPALYVTTTVVDLALIRPVLLSQVIQNPPDGLRFLKTEVVKVARRKGDSVDTAGLAPKLANWANWQTTAKGMTFHFNDYQLGGHGLRAYTVPWPRARLVLSGYGVQLLLPRGY